jgi:hypothetical protein
MSAEGAVYGKQQACRKTRSVGVTGPVNLEEFASQEIALDGA